MNDAQVMQWAQAEDHLDEDAPYLSLRKPFALTAEHLDFCAKISTVYILHHDA